MGLYLRKQLKNGAEISVWEVTETEEELLNIISIPNDELEELFIIKSEARRREKLAVRALLNTIFEEKVYLGDILSEVEVGECLLLEVVGKSR